MGKGDAKKAKEQLDALVEEWKQKGRKVKVTQLTKQEAADLVARFETEAYVVEDEEAAETTVLMMAMPTKVSAD